MELYKLHVHQFGARIVGEGHAVSGVFPRVGSDGPRLADAAGRQHDRLRLEDNEPSLFAPIAECAGNTVAVFQQSRDRALHINVNAHVDTAVLQGANHFEAGSIADVTQALESMSPKGALQDAAIFGAVEERAPLFEFAHSIA